MSGVFPLGGVRMPKMRAKNMMGVVLVPERTVAPHKAVAMGLRPMSPEREAAAMREGKPVKRK